jgi:hypothetical protein
MKAGFGKVDITSRLGVEMAGFGAYLHRVATEIRDHLYARALAVDDGHDRWVLVSCDLLGVEAATVAEARELIAQATGLTARQIMVHATHTHSAPATSYFVGWGEQDGPYMERLPSLIARAAIEAVGNLAEASFAYAAPSAEHFGYCREVEGKPTFEDALKEDWQPQHPELTDRAAHVIRVQGTGGLLGFVSSFSCHPVVCCEHTHSLHGDFVGVATNIVESELPGCVGMFLQGSHGDINSAFCHEPQDRSMHALNVMAARYARVIRAGLAAAKPIAVTPVASASEGAPFQRADWTEQRLTTEMAARRAKILTDPAGDASSDCRLDTVFLNGMRKVLADLKTRGTHRAPVEMQAIRAGDLRIVATPFELFRDIKERLVRESGRPALLVLSTTNDCAGYAVSQRRFAKAAYAAEMVPFILGICPLTPAIEEEITASGLRLLSQLDTAGA